MTIIQLGKTPENMARVYGVQGIVDFINNYTMPY